MLWIKSLHIVFVTSWFAGLFYLPRIFVNLAMVPEGSVAEHARLILMANKLYRFMTILAVPAVGLGLWLWLYYGIGLQGTQWLDAYQTIFGGARAGLPPQLWSLVEKVSKHSTTDASNHRSHVWYRWYNELPVLLLLAIVILVVLKPF